MRKRVNKQTRKRHILMILHLKYLLKFFAKVWRVKRLYNHNLLVFFITQATAASPEVNCRQLVNDNG